MGWKEHIENGVDIIHSPYWLTSEGVNEGCDILMQTIQTAMTHKGGLWELIQPSLWAWRPVSPVEWSSKNGFTNFAGEFRYKEKKVNEIQKLLEKYDIKLIIASMVFTFHQAGLQAMLDPVGTSELGRQANEAFDLSKKKAQSQGEVVSNLATLLSRNESWRLLQSPKGRIEFFVEPTRVVIEKPLLLCQAIQRVKSDWGNPLNKEQKIYPYNVSVSLSVEHLLQDKLIKR